MSSGAAEGGLYWPLLWMESTFWVSNKRSLCFELDMWAMLSECKPLLFCSVRIFSLSLSDSVACTYTYLRARAITLRTATPLSPL